MAGKCHSLETGRIENVDIQSFRLQYYCSGLVLVATLTLLCRFLDIGHKVENGAIVLLYLLPVLFSAYHWGRGPSFFTALIGVAAFEFTIMDANWRIMLAGNSHLWSLGIYFLVAFLIGDRTDHLRQKATHARVLEPKLSVLYGMDRNNLEFADLQCLVAEMTRQVGVSIERKTSILLSSDAGNMEIWGEYDPRLPMEEQRQFAIPQVFADSLEAATAAWTYQYGQISESAVLEPKVSTILFVPLKVSHAVIGVLRIDVGEKGLSEKEKQLTDSWASLAASALDKLLQRQNRVILN